MLSHKNNYLKRFLNVQFGLIGALIISTIVFFINIEHGYLSATTAGLKQAAYTFLFGGAIIKLLEFLLVKIDNRYVSIPLSVLIVSVITTILIFVIHSLKGTPEPVLSILPTIIMAPPGFLALSLRFKKNHKR